MKEEEIDVLPWAQACDTRGNAADGGSHGGGPAGRGPPPSLPQQPGTAATLVSHPDSY